MSNGGDFELGFNANPEEFIQDAMQEAVPTVLNLESRILRNVETSKNLGKKRVDAASGKINERIGSLLADSGRTVRPLIQLSETQPDEAAGRQNLTINDPANCFGVFSEILSFEHQITLVRGCSANIRFEWEWNGNPTGFILTALRGPENFRFVLPARENPQSKQVFSFDLFDDQPWQVVAYCENQIGGVKLLGSQQLTIPKLDCQPEQPPTEPPSEPPTEPPEEPQECKTCCCCPCTCDKPTEPPIDPSEPPPGTRWNVWKAVGSDSCYVLPEGDPPTSEKDEFKVVRRTKEQAEEYAAKECVPDDPEGPEEPTEIPFTSSVQSAVCDANDWLRRLASDDGFRPIMSGMLNWINDNPGLIDSIKTGVRNATASNPLFAGMTEGWLNLLDVADFMLRKYRELLKGFGCDDGTFFDAKSLSMLFDIFEQWVGSDISQVSVPTRYVANYECPYLWPTSGQAIEAWIRGEGSEAYLESVMRMNGACPEPFEPVVRAQRSKMAPGELISSLLRGNIDRKRFDKEIRAHGFIEGDESELFAKLGEFIPPPTDLVRFMQRDVEDTKIINKFGLDDEFGDKFRNETARWAEQQGISPDVMNRYWRAHWSIPSPTQLYEMFHRLRNSDDPAVKVDEDIVKTALKQQDILPYWVPRLLEISFNPLTRVDTRRAYDLGDIDEKGVRKSYEAQGYSDENVDTLTKFSTTLKEEGVESQRSVTLFKRGLLSEQDMIDELLERGFNRQFVSDVVTRLREVRIRGVHSERPYRQYLEGLLDEDELKKELRQRFYPEDLVFEAVVQANRELEFKFRKQCVDAIKTRFLWGELTSDEARERLIELGVPVLFADNQSKQFECELVTREKQGTLREFRQWLEYGTATPEEIIERLRRLRYSEDSATKIVSAMVERLRLREEKEARAEQEKIERDLKKRERERLRNAKQNQALANKARRLREAAEAARDRRAISITQAAAKFADKFGVDIDSTGDRLRALASFIRGTTDLNENSRVALLVKAVDQARRTDNGDLESIAQAMAENAEEWLDQN